MHIIWSVRIYSTLSDLNASAQLVSALYVRFMLNYPKSMKEKLKTKSMLWNITEKVKTATTTWVSKLIRVFNRFGQESVN